MHLEFEHPTAEIMATLLQVEYRRACVAHFQVRVLVVDVLYLLRPILVFVYLVNL